MTPFTYTRAGSAMEATTALLTPGTKLLGGGTNLIDLMKMEVEKPSALMDINRLHLAQIEDLPGGKGMRIGALARNSDVAEHAEVMKRFPVLSRALLAGASPQLRNMATIGGNLLQRTRCPYFYDSAFPACNKRQPGSGCGARNGFNRMHAILGQSEQCIAVHPSDMCVALAALEAGIRVQSTKGERVIAMEDFHRLPDDTPQIETNLAPEEMITAVEVPELAPQSRSTYLKIRDRASYAFALVSVAGILQMEGGTITRARLALGGVAHKPWRAKEAEALLEGQKADTALFQKAADAALANAKGYTHNQFKIELAKRCLVRVLQQLSTAEETT